MGFWQTNLQLRDEAERCRDQSRPDFERIPVHDNRTRRRIETRQQKPTGPDRPLEHTPAAIHAWQFRRRIAARPPFFWNAGHRAWLAKYRGRPRQVDSEIAVRPAT